MSVRFIHTADIHLGKTYRNSKGEAERYDDFFLMLSLIVDDAVRESVDFMLISGDLFHHGSILPKTFARTIETLQPVQEAGIPCVCVEGNHDWIHRRDSISWMEALSEMGYIKLLRPTRTEDGGYRFDSFDEENGIGGHIEIGGLNLYGLGYIGAHAGSHVQRVCEAITTDNNLLLFHVGIWEYSPVEIGNMKIEEAHALADTFHYVALGHGHKPYIVKTPDDLQPYAYNPGAPERVNFGEEKYEKGYYFVSYKNGEIVSSFRPTSPRPMLVEVMKLDGCETAEDAAGWLREQTRKLVIDQRDGREPLLELKLVGKVGFHPFELGREKILLILEEKMNLLHVEVKNHLSLVTGQGDEGSVVKSLAEIERDVLHDLIQAHSGYKGREDELTRLSLSIRDLVLKGDVDGEELLGLLKDNG